MARACNDALQLVLYLSKKDSHHSLTISSQSTNFTMSYHISL